MLTYDFRLPPGPRTVEYAILASAIAAVILAIVYLLGVETFSSFDDFYQLFLAR